MGKFLVFNFVIYIQFLFSQFLNLAESECGRNWKLIIKNSLKIKNYELKITA